MAEDDRKEQTTQFVMAAGYALITGASGGLGSAFARVLYARGYPLVLTGRNKRKLLELKRELQKDGYGSARCFDAAEGTDAAAYMDFSEWTDSATCKKHRHSDVGSNHCMEDGDRRDWRGDLRRSACRGDAYRRDCCRSDWCKDDSRKHREDSRKHRADNRNGLRHAKAPIVLVVCDLAKPDGPEQLYDLLQRRKIQVDLLVNNAGVGFYGAFLDRSWKDLVQVVDVNVRALCALTYLFGQKMQERGQGKILQVASVAAFAPSPYAAMYYASKAFVLSFSMAIAREWKNQGVQVCVLCPNRTESGFDAAAGVVRAHARWQVPAKSAIAVAEHACDALEQGKSVVLDGPMTYALALASHFVPGGVLADWMGNINKPV